ncbi:MAG: hypothetical protein BTN85_1936 [Candidatus Methanohalarchaeum thermophilum]|uniref:Uncharacterized protein n=1 Tax=Methanohalarchaeum thermophilum TaxID=1903181 RepID=A0A1Q6DSH2_METT1|nr:MAG: hypothetical protein BTN85_1936 [Candidatus Methanohalarchaeum thermophilum]
MVKAINCGQNMHNLDFSYSSSSISSLSFNESISDFFKEDEEDTYTITFKAISSIGNYFSLYIHENFTTECSTLDYTPSSQGHEKDKKVLSVGFGVVESEFGDDWYGRNPDWGENLEDLGEV